MATSTGSALRPERLPLNNGLVLLHNRAAANPSVVVRALVGAGASRETSTEYGLASLTGRMLRQGTRNISKSALAEELDGMGAGLSVDVGYAMTAVSIKCLSGDFPRAMQILGELLRQPTFPADELERLRGQVLTELKEMDDNTRVVAERTWRELAFPASQLPPLRLHWTRDFLLLVDGWAKDADANTAFSQTVTPLPFHRMSAYPYKPSEHFPSDAEHAAYVRDYLTRPALRLIRPLAPAANSTSED